MAARTKRNERGTYADGGAVLQEGKLPIYDCLQCGREVVWATSSKTGRKYLVNICGSESGSGRKFYRKDSVHRCDSPAEIDTKLQELHEDNALGVMESLWEAGEDRGWSRQLWWIGCLLDDNRYDLAAAAYRRRYG